MKRVMYFQIVEDSAPNAYIYTYHKKKETKEAKFSLVLDLNQDNEYKQISCFLLINNNIIIIFSNLVLFYLKL